MITLFNYKINIKMKKSINIIITKRIKTSIIKTSRWKKWNRIINKNKWIVKNIIRINTIRILVINTII